MSSQDIQRQEQQLRESDADLKEEQQTSSTFKSTSVNGNAQQAARPYKYVPLRMGGGGRTHKPSEGSRSIIENEVSLDDLRNMTNKFYELAFQDTTLDKLIRSHKDPHGERFARWIHQKLAGSTVWDEERQTRDVTPHVVAGGRRAVVHDRSSAHAAAWYSPKRPKNEVGRHFNLEECRVWMRLHFWAMRECGLVERSPTFCDYYLRFIGHFVAVYENSAPPFARESFRWSANPDNTAEYIQNGRKMTDVLGVRFQDAIKDLPEEELSDEYWPYYVDEQ